MAWNLIQINVILYVSCVSLVPWPTHDPTQEPGKPCASWIFLTARIPYIPYLPSQTTDKLYLITKKNPCVSTNLQGKGIQISFLLFRNNHLPTDDEFDNQKTIYNTVDGWLTDILHRVCIVYVTLQQGCC